jgi:hypothetical protein
LSINVHIAGAQDFHMDRNPLCEPSADWWELASPLILTTAAGINGFTCFLKHEEVWDSKFLDMALLNEISIYKIYEI